MPLFINLEKIPYLKYAKEVGGQFTFSDGKADRLVQRMGTKGLNTCVGFAFHTPTKNEMYHLAPEYRAHQDPQFVRNFIEAKIHELRDGYGNVKAFIFGGRANDKGSFELANNIANPIEDAGVEFTMIWGKKGNIPTDEMSLFDNRLSIWNDAFKNTLQKKAGISKDQKLNLLEDTYEIVYTNGNDILTIGK